ncbi:MAG TPA: hypothetical protein VII06_20350 [Chloroflexota bacterium]|jgi:hypothetical protein
MRRTIYLSDELASQVEDYLSWHPELTFSTLVRQALDQRVNPPDHRAFLERAGLVKKDSPASRMPPDGQVVEHDA